jgi:hypothetical protein
MHLLYLDDSGKVHPNDPAKVAVFAGFSVDEHKWHDLVRQISGAKARFFPKRASGIPHDWELKSEDFLTLNSWQRAKNRNFCIELTEILARNGCKVYAVTLEKAKAKDPLEEQKFVPLMLQRLIRRFHDQVLSLATTGTVVLDWSTHQLDEHVTRCVSAMTVSQDLRHLIGGVTYGGSAALPPLQVADLIASALRRNEEGQSHVADFARRLRELQFVREGYLDEFGNEVKSIVKVF